jgi:hypothetical protein
MNENNDVNEQVQNPTFSWEVVSSTQDTPYKVLTDNVNWSCTCLGYFYRGDCKHIKQIKENFNP